MREMRILSKRAFIILGSLCALSSFMACKAKEADKPAAQAPAAQLTFDKVDILDVNTMPAKGAANPKVTIVEFSDYQCPFCSRVEGTVKQILEAYPNDVKVVFVNRPLGFHDKARPAAKAAVAAGKIGGNDAYWKMHDKIFANQATMSEDNYKVWAKELGLDEAAFDAARNAENTEAYIKSGEDVAEANGISGTPSFLINGVSLVGAQPFEKFKEAIDKEIQRADAVAAEKKLTGSALYAELVNSAPKPEVKKPEPPKPPAKPVIEDETIPDRVFTDVTGAPVFGDENAPVTLVEFTDFQCPYCSRANATVHELVKANPGKVKLVYRAFPLDFHDKAQLAHQAAEAAKAQGKFWDYYDKLFANQQSLDRDSLINFAKELGLDEAKFVADMDNEATVNAVKADIAAGGKAGVQGTPHFIMNGRVISGALPLNAFQKALDEELTVVDQMTAKGITNDKLFEEIVKENIKPVPAPLVVDITNAPVKGAADAPVTIIQFSEFQCPYCKRVEPTLDALLANPAYAGKVKVVFKQFPLGFHDKAQKASEAALGVKELGGDDAFWKFHKLMFDNQPKIDVDDILGYAKTAGLSDSQVETLKADIESGKYAAAVEADVKAGQNVGISGTPSFVINGRLVVGALPVEHFEAYVDYSLKKLNK